VGTAPSVDCAVRGTALIGESPVWSVAEGALYWVDMPGRLIHRRIEGATHVDTWPTRSDIGALAICKAGGLIAALEDGLYHLDPDRGSTDKVVDPTGGDTAVQFNDGKCDRFGRFWAGTMDRVEQQPLGALYRLDPDGRSTRVLDSIITSNGLGWSPDNRTMYHTDSWTYRISAYDFDPGTGDLADGRVFIQDDPNGDGLPDGLTVDAEGGVWSAKWDGWRVVRYAPDGSIDTVVPMPVARPTSCTFGGPNLDRLYITTARYELTAGELVDQPLAGSVFVLEPSVGGLPDPCYG
jgi:sugar lactone lactonase YvrE